MPPIRFDLAERRRKFVEAISKVDISPTPVHSFDAVGTALVGIEQLTDLDSVIPTSNSQLRVTRTLDTVVEDRVTAKTDMDADRVPSVQDARSSPIPALLTCRTQTAKREEKYREKLYATAAAAYAAYYEIEGSDNLWKEFAKVAQACNAVKRPIRLGKDRDKALLLVMRFVFGWSHDYDRAYKLARGLELYRLRNLQPENVLPQLKRDRIEGLYKTACKKLPYRGKSANEKALMRIAYGSAAAPDCFDDLDDGSADRTANLETVDSIESELKCGGRNVFCVEIDDQQLATILAAPEHQRLSVWFESAGTLTDGSRRFIAVRVNKVCRKRSDD